MTSKWFCLDCRCEVEASDVHEFETTFPINIPRFSYGSVEYWAWSKTYALNKKNIKKIKLKYHNKKIKQVNTIDKSILQTWDNFQIVETCGIVVKEDVFEKILKKEREKMFLKEYSKKNWKIK